MSRAAGFAAIILLLAACKQGPMPSYVHIESVQVTTDYPSEGSASNKIVDCWLYLDENALGVYELPATIPISFAGNHKVSILAGVLKDGKSVERIAYPFYSLFSQIVQLTKGQIDTVMPVVTYNGFETFIAIEDFDGGAGFGMNRTTMSSLVYEGTGSGMVAMDLSGPVVTTQSELYAFPTDGSRIFLELDYRNETPFDIFLFDSKTAQDHYIITITPKDLWNKVYVDLTFSVHSYVAPQYSIKFRSELPDSTNEAVNYWDNIKILHL